LFARYKDALSVANALLELARRYRLDFAIPYACCSAGIAHAGTRAWSAAAASFEEGVELARDGSNRHAEQACLAAHARMFVQQARYGIALERLADLSAQPDRPVVTQMHAEFVATKALAMAGAGNLDHALRMVDTVRGISRSIDATVLTEAVDAAVSVKRHDSDAIERTNHLLETGLMTGGLDHVVTTYRGIPEVMTILLRSQSQPFSELVHRVGDDDLAKPLGYTISAGGRIWADLTARERDVLELLQQSMTNREIATMLYIAEPTVKLHVQHIFDKLGVRSRKAIAMQAALERSAQATSAIDDTGVGTDS
jgi:DNA-binding NarL/FixJ family response regulator